MEKTKLIQARQNKGFDRNEFADLIQMEHYSYRRREKGEVKISHSEWEKMAKVLGVAFDDIFEADANIVNINNGEGQINNHTHKIEYYNIPKEMVASQQEYIILLKEKIKKLEQENQVLKEKIQLPLK
jgi:transcriptional regulator with XRE-family HTH domain